METKDLEICPNCGRKLDGSEFQPTWDMPMNWLPTSVDPVMGRFRCPDCDFNGIAIKVPPEEYTKMEFKRNTSFTTSAPKVRKFLGVVLLFLLGIPVLALLDFNIIAILLWLGLLIYLLKGETKEDMGTIQALFMAIIFIAVLILAYIVLKGYPA